MKLKIMWFSFLFLLLVSCKSAFLENAKALELKPLIGTVGNLNSTLTSNKFVQIGLPKLEGKIKLWIEKSPFTHKSLRRYNRKVYQDGKKLQIVDSLDLHPMYYNVGISDKVGFISALNAEINKKLKDYLESTGNNVLLTSISIYFPPKISTLIDNASGIYLVNNGKSSYSLEIMDGNGKAKDIEFAEGVSFGYAFSGFCWKENYKREAVIAAFTKKGKNCPGVTEKKAGKVYSEDLFDNL